MDPVRRQEDPELPRGHPSFLLYALFILVAMVLIWWAFTAGPRDWPALALNLATEIIGSIVIVAIVLEGRIGSKDRKRFHSMWLYIRGQDASLRAYAEDLVRALEAVRPEEIVEQPEQRRVVEDIGPGFVLVGEGGVGKTFVLQDLALRQARRFLSAPHRERLPVFVSLRRWRRAPASTAVWYIGMRRVRFRLYKRLLEGGRLMVLLDGVDESRARHRAPAELGKLVAAFPDCAFVVSTDPSFELQIGLPERRLGSAPAPSTPPASP